MPWEETKINGYHTFAKNYISSYANKIDCADLAQSGDLILSKKSATLGHTRIIYLQHSVG